MQEEQGKGDWRFQGQEYLHTRHPGHSGSWFAAEARKGGWSWGGDGRGQAGYLGNGDGRGVERSLFGLYGF